MRVEHRMYTNKGSKLVHKIDTNESAGFIEVVLPNGQRLQLEDSGSTNAIEVRLVQIGRHTQMSIEPVVGNAIRLRAGEKAPL